MKLVLGAALVILCSISVSWAKSPAEWFDDLAKNERLCRRQNRLPQGNLPDLTENSPRNLKCYVRCQFETNLDIKISDGDQFAAASLQAFKDMNPKATDTVITRHAAILNRCKNKKGTDDCDTAAKISICTGEEYVKIKRAGVKDSA